MSIDRSRGLYIEGLSFMAKRASNGDSVPIAYVGIDIDQTSAPGPLTSDIVFERIAVDLPGSSANQAAFRGIQISNTSVNNVEDIVVRDSYIACQSQTGVGIFIGPSDNAKNESFEHTGVTRCGRGLELRNGSFRFYDSDFSQNLIDFYVSGGWTEPITIQGIVSEGDQQFIVVHGGPEPAIRIIGNKAATTGTPPGAAVFAMGDANHVYLEGNKTEGDADKIFSAGFSSLVSKNNTFHTGSLATSGIATFKLGYTVEDDSYYGAGFANLTGFQMNSNGSGVPVPFDVSRATTTAPIAAGTPSSSSAQCKQNQVMLDANYIYVCTSANRWKRAPLSNF